MNTAFPESDSRTLHRRGSQVMVRIPFRWSVDFSRRLSSVPVGGGDSCKRYHLLFAATVSRRVISRMIVRVVNITQSPVVHSVT